MRLYFDVEREWEGGGGVRVLVGEVFRFLKLKFGPRFEYNLEDIISNINSLLNNVVDISGSYSTKFSRHLIFEDVIFEDNITCGRFVKDFVEQWNEEEVRERWGEEYSSIFYNEEKVEEGMDVDSTCTGT